MMHFLLFSPVLLVATLRFMAAYVTLDLGGQDSCNVIDTFASSVRICISRTERRGYGV
jgi:hypothetical protein